MTSRDSFKTRRTLSVAGKSYDYFSLAALKESGIGDPSRLPFSLKVLLENLLRNENGTSVTSDDIKAVFAWLETRTSTREIAFHPARVLMQDFTGVPAVVDLAAMRDAMQKLGGDATRINPLCPVDLVIDHSVQVDFAGTNKAFSENVNLEMDRNHERYEFLRWGQDAFQDFRVVPPGTGICHQVNLEYLAQGVWQNRQGMVYPDTLVGTDSHTTMINGLGVLGWGVGGIEAEAAMLGQPYSMLIPEVVGFKLTGKLPEGVTATDLVLTITQMLRKKGVVNKFVEFFGPGLNDLSLPDRATIANMAPEYGATCGFFPIDQETARYLSLSSRDVNVIALVENYCKVQGLWRETTTPDPIFTDTLELELSSVVSTLAGPKRPQDKVAVQQLPTAFSSFMAEANKQSDQIKAYPVAGTDYAMHHGDVVIAAITSCTNTSNPSVMLAAGLVAKKACEKGLKVKPWVKTSLAPGSKVVTDYLEKSNLQGYLNQLGFDLVGYGCTTCIGNSGPLDEPIAKTITANDLVVAAVLSGNRNFEGRVHPQVRANWLASPPLVVAYALAGTCNIDLSKEPVGLTSNNEPVYLKDIWPSNAEVAAEVAKITANMYHQRYADVFSGDDKWQLIPVKKGKTFQWNDKSTYVQNPPYFEALQPQLPTLHDIVGGRVLALLGDSVTTDHISPAGNIKADSPAGKYLQQHGVQPVDFNSYGSRRGNHEVMMRGTFANIRIRNEMAAGKEGGFTKYIPSGEIMPIYDAAMLYKAANTPLVVVAGKEYGTGSSRDWAAKGVLLLGVRAVITESFERIHRSNLIGMGVLPLQFKPGQDRKTLKFIGDEVLSITGLDKLQPRGDVTVLVQRADGKQESIVVTCRIDTQTELNYYRNGGILQFVLRSMITK